jgi:hypothetical protein
MAEYMLEGYFAGAEFRGAEVALVSMAENG